jgi:hypothetical protein
LAEQGGERLMRVDILIGPELGVVPGGDLVDVMRVPEEAGDFSPASVPGAAIHQSRASSPINHSKSLRHPPPSSCKYQPRWQSPDLSPEDRPEGDDRHWEHGRWEIRLRNSYLPGVTAGRRQVLIRFSLKTRDNIWTFG